MQLNAANFLGNQDPDLNDQIDDYFISKQALQRQAMSNEDDGGQGSKKENEEKQTSISSSEVLKNLNFSHGTMRRPLAETVVLSSLSSDYQVALFLLMMSRDHCH